MKIITPSYTIQRPCALDAVARKDALHAIANAARTCYKSTGTDDATLVAQLVRNGHEAMLEQDAKHNPDDVSEICELKDRVENLTLYLQEVFDTDIQLYDWLDKRHPGLPGYAPNISNN